MNPLYVGIDVSSKSNVVYLMLLDGEKHSNFSVPNSQDGSTQMVKRILSIPVPTPEEIRKKGAFNLVKENPFLYIILVIWEAIKKRLFG